MIDTRTARLITALSVALVLALVSRPLLAEKTWELKFATLAPAGTTWMNLLLFDD